MIHKTSRVFGKGTDSLGYTDWEQVVCTCGWKSPQVANYNDYKWTTLREFEGNRLRKARLEMEDEQRRRDT